MGTCAVVDAEEAILGMFLSATTVGQQAFIIAHGVLNLIHRITIVTQSNKSINNIIVISLDHPMQVSIRENSDESEERLTFVASNRSRLIL